MKETSKRWIEAAKILANDSNVKVQCPECNIGVLLVKDESIPEWGKVDRYLICSNCGKWNVITMDGGVAD